RKKPLEPRKRFRERKIISIENVHSQPPIRFTPTLDVVGVGVKRIGTDAAIKELYKGKYKSGESFKHAGEKL
ncbi:MAG: hypothetical protein QGF16_07285, partial [Rhodospirillales bacterium]|nr:hypothetical protein [Rhodospirillales bacterium]